MDINIIFDRILSSDIYWYLRHEKKTLKYVFQEFKTDIAWALLLQACISLKRAESLISSGHIFWNIINLWDRKQSSLSLAL